MCKKANEKGFSLIEVLIAMVILTVALLGTGALLVGIIRGNLVSKHVTMATILAQEKMEEMKARGYSGISSSDTTITEGYDAISGYPNNMRVTRIFVDTPETGMKTLTIESSWRAGSQPVILNAIIVR